VNGSTITLTDENGKTYTVDASTAKIDKVSPITIANIVQGDRLEIKGAIDGDHISATHIMDGVPEKQQQ
jgi:hypothetical protein